MPKDALATINPQRAYSRDRPATKWGIPAPTSGEFSSAIDNSALAITTALTLRAVFRLALRQTEGLIGSIIRLLGLDLAVPDHSTLSRRAETLQVVRPRWSSVPVHLIVGSHRPSTVRSRRMAGREAWRADASALAQATPRR
jgi:hypothetical protein